MAIIKAGILSKVSGKVAGVVGSTWKGQNYLRERVKPANPNTALQQRQRGKMRSVVAYARGILGNVLAIFVDPFCKNFSGYNWYVKNNIAKIDPETGYFTAAPDISFGSGYAPVADAAFCEGGPWYVRLPNGVQIPTGYTANGILVVSSKDSNESISVVKPLTNIDTNTAFGDEISFSERQVGAGDFASFAVGLFDANGNLVKLSNTQKLVFQEA